MSSEVLFRLCRFYLCITKSQPIILQAPLLFIVASLLYKLSLLLDLFFSFIKLRFFFHIMLEVSQIV